MSTVIFWLSHNQFYRQDLHSCIRDVILGVTPLCLFIIQKSFNHFAASLHLKVNELVALHPYTSNLFINLEKKTEQEMTVLAKEAREEQEKTV